MKSLFGKKKRFHQKGNDFQGSTTAYKRDVVVEWFRCFLPSSPLPPPNQPAAGGCLVPWSGELHVAGMMLTTHLPCVPLTTEMGVLYPQQSSGLLG